jgi:chemotaxis methyl-accepting protein methylase
MLGLWTTNASSTSPRRRARAQHLRLQSVAECQVHLNNLVNDDLHLPSQDVIFCQNVLMYFGLESRAAIVRRLTARLGPGGFLFTAPAELIGLELPDIEPVSVRDTLIYRRRLNEEA